VSAVGAVGEGSETVVVAPEAATTQLEDAPTSSVTAVDVAQPEAAQPSTATAMEVDGQPADQEKPTTVPASVEHNDSDAVEKPAASLPRSASKGGRRSKAVTAATPRSSSRKSAGVSMPSSEPAVAQLEDSKLSESVAPGESMSVAEATMEGSVGSVVEVEIQSAGQQVPAVAPVIEEQNVSDAAEGPVVEKDSQSLTESAPEASVHSQVETVVGGEEAVSESAGTRGAASGKKSAAKSQRKGRAPRVQAAECDEDLSSTVSPAPSSPIAVSAVGAVGEGSETVVVAPEAATAQLEDLDLKSRKPKTKATKKARVVFAASSEVVLSAVDDKVVETAAIVESGAIINTESLSSITVTESETKTNVGKPSGTTVEADVVIAEADHALEEVSCSKGKRKSRAAAPVSAVVGSKKPKVQDATATPTLEHASVNPIEVEPDRKATRNAARKENGASVIVDVGPGVSSASGVRMTRTALQREPEEPKILSTVPPTKPSRKANAQSTKDLEPDEIICLVILCDGCDAEFDLDEAGLASVPAGDWFCVACTAKKASKAKAVTKKSADVVLLCDGCDGEYQLKSLGLPKIPAGDWYCAACTKTQSQSAGRKRKAPVVELSSKKTTTKKH